MASGSIFFKDETALFQSRQSKPTDSIEINPYVTAVLNELKLEEFNFERFSKLGQRVLGNEAYTFEYLDLSKKDKFADDFVTIYNQAWSTHDFFVPITKKLILEKMKEMKPVVTNGMSALRSACLYTMRRRLAPLALAVRM